MFKFDFINLKYIFISIILLLIIFIVMMISWYKLFKKAGKKGYIAFIPFYNIWTLFEIGNVKGFYSLLILIPLLGLLIFIILYYKALVEIVRRLDKNKVLAILCIFFPIFIYPYLGFSSSIYEVKPVVKETSILDIDLEGVIEDKEFNYGYEKEDTEVMKPIKKKTGTKKKTTKKK